MIAEKEFLTCEFGQMFKTVIIDDKDYTFLEAILSNILGGKPKVVSLPRTVVKKDTKSEKAKDRDLVVELDGTYINLEVVTGHGREIRSQLFTYHHCGNKTLSKVKNMIQKQCFYKSFYNMD